MSTSETQAAPQGKATPTPAASSTNGGATTTPTASSTNGGAPPIAKPNGGGLERFKSKRSGTPANVEVLLPPLTHSNIGGSKDFVRLHPNETEYWSNELCFVNVPVHGQKRDTLHLIDEDLAMRHLDSSRIKRCRLALATKPHDNFFLCEVPSQNLDNTWNQSALLACEQAKTQWIIATSRKAEGADSYKIKFAQDNDSFPEPKWPSQTLDELILTAFKGRQIDTEDHPAMLRLVGAKQNVS
jgi:hypothetical protein